MIHLLQMGNDIYLPVAPGDHIGIGIYNGASTFKAYPMFVEALNLWQEGPPQPNDCSPDQMWEVKPLQQMIVDSLMGTGQTGRPLVIVAAGSGMSIGEATFGTGAYNGQIRIYERSSKAPHYHRPHFQSHPEPLYRDRGHESLGTRSGAKGLTPQSSSIGIGAGDEKIVPNYDTGVQYNRDSRLVVSLRLKSQSEFDEMLNRVWGTGWSYYWQHPHSPTWWDEPWTWQWPSSTRVQPHIPVA